jgi:nitrate reductase gamma subunit
MTRADWLLWVVIPYVCLTVFVVGHVWRYRRDQLTWTTRSTQLLEGRWLRPGILLFHLGLLAVIGGHVLGLLVPKSLTDAAGLPEWAYHDLSVTMGTLSGTAMTVGFLILVVRRGATPRVRSATSHLDIATYTLLGIVMLSGMAETVGRNLLGGGYDYRATVAPWFRGLFALRPDPGLMASAPLIYQVHITLAFLLLALWPFSRLVHAWSVPVAYLRRSPILYRSRALTPAPSRVIHRESLGRSPRATR